MSKPTENIWAREKTPGGIQQRQPYRKFELQAKDFSNSEQAVPVRVTYGTTETAGIYITPVFGLRSEPIKTEQGK